jgi:hypothetical protein
MKKRQHDSTTFASWYRETHPTESDLVHIQKDPAAIELYKALQQAWWIFWIDRLIEQLEQTI